MADAIWNNRYILSDPSKNETVLWQDLNNTTQLYSGSTDFNLTESFLNFEKIKVYFKHSFSGSVQEVAEGLVIPNSNLILGISGYPQGDNNYIQFDRAIICFYTTTNTVMTVKATTRAAIQVNGTTISCNVANNGIIPIKVVGLNRISGGN